MPFLPSPCPTVCLRACSCSRVFKNLDYRNLGLIEVYDLSQRLLQETVERSKPLNRLRCLSCEPAPPLYSSASLLVFLHTRKRESSTPS